MTEIGYTLMCEQSGPKELIADARRAEEAGFPFAVISDHYFPWLEEQGHSPYAWSVLGAVAQVTERLELMTYVTCPIKRYHPAVVAQKAATVQVLSDGRFSLGLGAGENLNEHVTGGGWPPANIRHERLSEAVEIIRPLLAGETVNHHGRHYHVDSAKVWDNHDTPIPIGIAVSGPQSCRLAGQQADFMIAVEPKAELGELFDRHGGTGKARVGQLPVSYDRDRDAAIKRAHAQFRWFGGGWRVNAELPGPAAFAAASQYVRPEDVAAAIPCGDNVEDFVNAVQPFVTAGFTHLALVQVGADVQADFVAWAARELLPALADLAAKK
jgi:G6PDH family F420-dependent oxidoreductase